MRTRRLHYAMASVRGFECATLRTSLPASNGASAGDRPRTEAVTELDLDAELARVFAGITVIELTDHICDAAMCTAQWSGQIVYRDRQHLAKAFTATLAGGFAGMFGAEGSPH